mgnify:CR=1 FL=1
MTIDNSLFIIHWIHSFPFNASTIGCLVVRHAGIPALNIFSKNVKIRAEINKPGLISIGAVRLTFSLNMKGFPTTNKTIERPMPITPPAMIARIQQAGIPVVAISLRQDAAGEKSKMNPTMADEEQAYNAGLMEGIRLIGEVVERQPEAKALIHYTFEARKQANAPVADIPQNQRVRVYMANPDLNTYGAGKYTGLMMAHAGALNVAAASVTGARQVSLEQVREWNPQVIFVQDRYPQVVKQIESDPQWQGIDAVKNHRVWLMPEYAKAWGYPMPEALALGELWMAKKLYPSRYNGVDVDSKAQEYYQRFYRVKWTPDAQ